MEELKKAEFWDLDHINEVLKTCLSMSDDQFTPAIRARLQDLYISSRLTRRWAYDTFASISRFPLTDISSYIQKLFDVEKWYIQPPLKHSVVNCGLVLKGDQLLLAKRKEDAYFYPNMWEIPGGVREPGETDAQCVYREIKEEVGATVAVGDLLATADYQWVEDERSATLNLFFCVSLSPFEIYHPHASQEIRWVKVSELPPLEECTPSCEHFFEAAKRKIADLHKPTYGFSMEGKNLQQE